MSKVKDRILVNAKAFTALAVFIIADSLLMLADRYGIYMGQETAWEMANLFVAILISFMVWLVPNKQAENG